jgi:hypothetical protein
MARSDGDARTVYLDDYDGSDLGEQWNAAIDDVGVVGTVFRLRPGAYELTTPVDYTGAHAGHHALDLQGCTIHVTGPGLIGIEAVGVGRLHVNVSGGKFVGDAERPPRTAMLLARGEEGHAAFWNFFGTEWDGTYTDAGFASVSAEANAFFGCRFQNDNDTGFTMAWTRDNYLAFESTYGTIADGDNPTSTNRFYGCGFVSKSQEGDGVVCLDGVSRVTFSGGFFRGGNTAIDRTEPMVYSPMRYDAEGVAFRDIQIELAGDFLRFDNDSGASRAWYNLELAGGAYGQVRGHLFNSTGADPAAVRSSTVFLTSCYDHGTGVNGGIQVETVANSVLNLGIFEEPVAVTEYFDSNVLLHGQHDDVVGDPSSVSNNVAVDTSTGQVVPGHRAVYETDGVQARRQIDPEDVEVDELAHLMATLLDDLDRAGIVSTDGTDTR